MASSIRFEGGEELRAKFRAMTEAARVNTLSQAVQPAAEYVKDAIFARAPVLTGKMAASIETVQLTETADRFVVGIQIAAEAFYWKFLEFGTKHQAPDPFIRTAVKSSRTAARNEMRDGIRDSILGFTE